MTCWQANWLADWSTDSLAGWLTNQLTAWSTDWLASWLTYQLTGWLINWLAEWLTDQLTCWLADWSTDWLTNQLRGSPRKKNGTFVVIDQISLTSYPPFPNLDTKIVDNVTKISNPPSHKKFGQNLSDLFWHITVESC